MDEPKLNAQERRELCAEACCDERTLRKCYSGKRCLSSTHKRITRAAETLGLPLPPAPTGGKGAA